MVNLLNQYDVIETLSHPPTEKQRISY